MTQENRLSYLLSIQEKLRAELHQGATDALRNGDNDGSSTSNTSRFSKSHAAKLLRHIDNLALGGPGCVVSRTILFPLLAPSLSPFLSASAAPWYRSALNFFWIKSKYDIRFSSVPSNMHAINRTNIPVVLHTHHESDTPRQTESLVST